MRQAGQDRVPMPLSTERLFVLGHRINSEKYKVLFSKSFTLYPLAKKKKEKKYLPFPVDNLLSNLTVLGWWTDARKDYMYPLHSSRPKD